MQAPRVITKTQQLKRGLARAIPRRPKLLCSASRTAGVTQGVSAVLSAAVFLASPSFAAQAPVVVGADTASKTLEQEYERLLLERTGKTLQLPADEAPQIRAKQRGAATEDSSFGRTTAEVQPAASSAAEPVKAPASTPALKLAFPDAPAEATPTLAAEAAPAPVAVQPATPPPSAVAPAAQPVAAMPAEASQGPKFSTVGVLAVAVVGTLGAYLAAQSSGSAATPATAAEPTAAPLSSETPSSAAAPSAEPVEASADSR